MFLRIEAVVYATLNVDGVYFLISLPIDSDKCFPQYGRVYVCMSVCVCVCVCVCVLVLVLGRGGGGQCNSANNVLVIRSAL